MSRHNLKTVCQLCTAFSSSHVTASSATLLPFFLFLFLALLFSLRRWGDVRRSQITFENISRADSCSNKNVSVIIHRAWNARYVFGRLHRSSAPSHEHRIFINVSNRDLYFAYIYIFIRICRFDTRKGGIRETLAWYRPNYWRLGVSLTSGLFIADIRTFREWNNRSFVDRAVRLLDTLQ